MISATGYARCLTRTPHHCMHALQVAAFPKHNGSRPRTVVFTQGKDATVVASHGKVCQGSRHGMRDLWDSLACAQVPVACLACILEGAGESSWDELCLLPQAQLYPVIPVAKEKLVDTNGAGDAFVGGEAERLPCPMSAMHVRAENPTQA